MKKTILLLSVLLTLAFAGALYGTLTERDERKFNTVENVLLNHFPDPMPDVMIHPMVEIPGL